MEEHAGVSTRTKDAGSCHDDYPTVETTSTDEGGSQVTAAVASVELVTDEDEDAAEEERLNEAAVNMAFLFLSVPLAVAIAAAVVWGSTGHGQPHELVLWRLSLLLCFFSTIWSRLLDDAAAAVSAKAALLFFSGSFSLAAALADAALGALLAHLNAHLAAAMLGYALAERHRRQRAGTEAPSASAALSSASSSDGRRLFFRRLAAAYVGAATLVAAAWVAWVVWRRAEYPVEDVVVMVFIPLAGAAMFWSIVVAAGMMRPWGALIGEAGFGFLVMYWVSFVFALAMVSERVGGVGAMVFVAIGALGFPGFLGYSLSVYASCKQRLKLGQLAVKPDESKEESPPRPLLQKQGEGSKDSPWLSMSSSATADEYGWILVPEATKGSSP